MEHDDEKIRDKVLLADRSPIAWNKQQVWNAIERRPKVKSRNLVFYYAAASTLLGVSLLLFSLENTRQHELAVQLAQLELAILQADKAPFIVYRDRPVTSAPDQCIPDTSPDKILVKKRKALPPVEHNAQTETVLLTEYKPEEKMELQTEPIVAEPLERSSTPTIQRVAAIIGSEKNNMISSAASEKRMVLKVQLAGAEGENPERKLLVGDLIIKH